jgi:cytochrome oxidase Cu insertion factor (SCO1/SenC/PrrC family)
MLRKVLTVACVGAAHGFTAGGSRVGPAGRMAAAQMSTLSDFSLTAIDGKPIDMASFKGKPVLILNVASL